MPSKSEAVASFIEGAPPGELSNVVEDIKALTIDDPKLLGSQEAAFRRYNETQYTTTKLPGSSEPVIVSEHNALDDGRYFDTATSTSFAFDHVSQKASDAQSYVAETKHDDLVKSLIKSFSTHAAEHYPSSTTAVYGTSNAIILVLVANKYSLNNFWTGRWRSVYVYKPDSSSIEGSIKLDVHYFEDGNVRMQTEKNLTLSSSSSTASDIVRQIQAAEKKYQQELNSAFTNLNEGAFKGLRRQLPVTRQKVEWEKIGGYRLGQDIGGGRSR